MKRVQRRNRSAQSEAHLDFEILEKPFAWRRKEKKNVAAMALTQLPLPPSNYLLAQNMDAHKLTGRLALAAVAVAAMQVSGRRAGRGREGAGS